MTRINHHNSIWGPFGRNLHEDLIGVQGQGTTMATGSEPRRILHGRHENQTIHDENGMRHYYQEWGRWMNWLPSKPDAALRGAGFGGCGIIVVLHWRAVSPIERLLSPSGRAIGAFATFMQMGTSSGFGRSRS